MSVKYTHKSYVKYSPKWKRVRDVASGQDAVHAAGQLYLPKLNRQTGDQYASYVMRTPFINFSWRTMEAFLGMLFRKEPTVEVPDAVKPYLTDITMQGKPFTQFAEQVALESLEVWRVGVLVDYPPVPAKPDGSIITVADAETLGHRPTMQLYKTETIINWKYRNINNKWTLALVVLKETANIPKDEFEDTQEDRYRVLDLIPEKNIYRMRVFKINDRGQDELVGPEIIPLMNGSPMGFIPFVFIPGDEEIEDPPLIDLVDLNLSHYITSADYEHGCHFTGLPTPWINGLTTQLDATGQPVPPEVYIGSESALILEGDHAGCGYMEFTGTGLGELAKNKTAKEASMAAIGARMLAPDKTGVEAAETMAMRVTGENSILASVSIAVSLGLKKALEIFVAWQGITATEEIKCDLNKEFLPFPMSPQQATAYIALVQAGHLSPEDLFALLQRADIIEADINFDEHKVIIDKFLAEQDAKALANQEAQAAIAAKAAPKGNQAPANA